MIQQLRVVGVNVDIVQVGATVGVTELGGRGLGHLFKDPEEVLFVLKAQLVGNLLDGEVGGQEELFGLFNLDLVNVGNGGLVLVGAEQQGQVSGADVEVVGNRVHGEGLVAVNLDPIFNEFELSGPHDGLVGLFSGELVSQFDGQAGHEIVRRYGEGVLVVGGIQDLSG